MTARFDTHAPSRAAEIEAQAPALDSFYIDGIRHNIPFLSALMHHPRWREGKLSTGFISEEFPKGFAVGAPEGEIARRLAAVGAAIDHVLGERKRQISGQMSGRLMPVLTAADSGKKLLCPMPGLVVSIAVAEGQEVKAGETLAVVEAMKMQNVLRAERDGTVKKIHAAPGATLAVDALILEFA